MDRGAWRTTVHGVAEELDPAEGITPQGRGSSSLEREPGYIDAGMQHQASDLGPVDMPIPVGEQGWSCARGTYGTSMGHVGRVFLEEAETMAECDEGTRLMDSPVCVCVTSVGFRNIQDLYLLEYLMRI